MKKYTFLQDIVVENIVQPCLYPQQKQLYYYENRGKYEIDFVIVHQLAALPIEVKSSTDPRPKRLRSLVDRFDTPLAHKLFLHNVNIQDAVVKSSPLYMMMFV